MNTKHLSIALLLVLLASTAQAGERIESSKSWTETYPVSSSRPSLEVSNIWGDVRVRPGKPGQIVVTVKEKRSAPDQQRFERSVDTLKLSQEASETGVALYVGNRDGNWHGRNTCRGCRVDYQFDVLVPPDAQVDVSTVNDGRIDIAGIHGRISAANVNGPIAIAEIHNCVELNNVNGEVRLAFATRPADNCEIETINGDVTISLPDGSGMDVAMELFNGRMSTQFPVDALTMTAKVEHTESNGRHQYRIEQPAGVRIGTGGPVFTISSLNGDIRIQKIN